MRVVTLIKSLFRQWDVGAGWRKQRCEWLRDHPKCAGCGGTKWLQVHRIDRWGGTERTNLLTLCMGKSECHLRVGHGGDWRARNPRVLKDAHECRIFSDERAQIEAGAQARRVFEY